MTRKLFNTLLILFFFFPVIAQIPQPIKQLLKTDYMKGATFSFIAKDINSGEILYNYDTDREVIPASVLKTVTTATALEILGPDYRFPTSLEYDGEIKDGVLYGNLYIKGSGDPTLGSSHFTPDRSGFTEDQYRFLTSWIQAIKKAGIRKIEGSVIADESIFDNEGVSPKWLYEDMGNYYGAGCYGLNVFDNLYYLQMSTGNAGEIPIIQKTNPPVSGIHFHNYLQTASVATDSAFVLGAPYSTERYLYGVVPANRSLYTLKGDIPDPALFIAQLLTEHLNKAGVITEKSPSCYRVEAEKGNWLPGKREVVVTTYSPTLQEIVRITNERSHNLYADALLKTLGLRYQPRKAEILSSFGKGVKVMQAHWKEKGLDVSSLNINDGSGLAVTNKITASFLCEMLTYMATESVVSDTYISSFPQAGSEGSVRNFLRGSNLQGYARLKSGGMSRVRCYAGYITKDSRRYAVAVFANNYNCEGREIIKALERLLTASF